MTENSVESVQVAVRVRPLIESETSKGCKALLEVYRDLNQIKIKSTDRGFTYNHVFDSNISQEEFYKICVKDLIVNLFKGYNVTILAYGQTGSGKTYSMGTSYSGAEEQAVIQRALHDIFNYVKDNFSYDFTITVSFMELYQEVPYDLLSGKSKDQNVVEIREDNKGIFIPGLTEKPVKSAYEALNYLMKGSKGRATGSTNMNAQSSRSHAIFTVNICMQEKSNSGLNRTAKFHLVDLAGSERSKKTGATGQTFREGVNINKGLLALGNVISSLGDEKLQQGYINYRESNLTRLLKDSLGGNSITLMIACVSPADYNLEETLSTLRYADRARKIKNKPVVNQDPKTAELNRLNKLVTQLRLELIGQGGPIICQAELELLKKESMDLNRKNLDLTNKLSTALTENSVLYERILFAQSANELLQKKLQDLQNEYNFTLNQLNISLENNDINSIKKNVLKLQTLQNTLVEIDCEYKKNQEELINHERNAVYNNAFHRDNAVNETEINEKQEFHTQQQIHLNIELQGVMKSLAYKEELCKQLAANSYHMVDYNVIAENETKIASLEKEKAQLLEQLKITEVTQKVVDNRRKRVKELEQQIQDLKKKVQEQARLIKLKEKDDLKIKQLNNDIVAMKQTKVKLIKQMRAESESFRNWKIQKERDLMKLKEQDRKRENQMIKMQTLYNRQQNVLKRKMEEAAAINKRLKDALALRKAAHDQKYNGKIVPWIQQELEIFVNTIVAEATLNNLLEDRASLQNQLDQLKSQNNLDENDLQIKQIEDDIETHSIQIQDIQQKLIDSDEAVRGKTRWDYIQSMGESKVALKSLFELTAEAQKKAIQVEHKLTEQQTIINELTTKLNEEHSNVKTLKSIHEEKLMDLERQYEEKVSVLLRELRKVNVLDPEEEREKRFSILHDRVEKYEHKIENLMQEISMLKEENKELNEKLNNTNGLTIKTPKPKKKSPETNSTYLTAQQDISDDSIHIEDDVTQDPDWRKTPLAKRVKSLIKQNTIVPLKDNTSKRTSGGGCSCKGECKRRNCSCRKTTRPCSSTCKCKETNCANRNKENIIDETSVDESESNLESNSIDTSETNNTRILKKIKHPIPFWDI